MYIRVIVRVMIINYIFYAGHVLKLIPAQRELDFYHKISNSSDPECQQWKELAPKFFGTEIFHGDNGESTECLVLGKGRLQKKKLHI